MRFKFILVLFFIGMNLCFAQLKTEINVIPVELKQATTGTLELHYCLFQRQYYFFIQLSDKTLIALSKDQTSSNFYKTKLSELTDNYGDTTALAYDLKPLKSYINSYNTSLDPNQAIYKEPKKLLWQGMLFTGFTNNPFVTNDSNILNALLGLELEVSGNVPVPRHSGFFQYRYAFSSNEFDYQTQEFALGYRYRLIRKSWGALFAQVKAATYNSSKATISNEENELVSVDSNSFDAAFIFGIGADLKIGKKSYITLIYGELFALFLNNQGNFPLDFSLGYKLKL